MVASLSYVHVTPDSPWGTYLSQVDRVIPYLGKLGRWAETLKRPKRALIVDVRDSAELAQTGKIAGALHIPRGSIEMKADLTAASADQNFAHDRPVIVHCAGGGRSALTVAALKEMGYENIANLDGGIKAWKESGKPVIG